MSEYDKIGEKEECVENNEPEVANLDRILIEEVGQLGWFQLRVIALCVLVAVCTGLRINLFIFTFAKVNTRCFIPECESCISTANFTPSWIQHAIPIVDGTFDHCHRFASISGNVTNFCSADMFDRSSLVKCTEYIYEHTNSAIYEYNLACDDWSPNLVGSVTFLGELLTPLGGVIADRWGRRVALFLSAFNTAWIGALLYFANSYICYVLIGFLSTIMGASCQNSAFIFALEYVGPKYRVIVVSMLSSSIAFGRFLTGMIISSDPYWRNFILIVYGPLLITFLYFWIAPESIRWLMSKNRHKEAIIILKKAADINGNALSKETLQSFKNAKQRKPKEKDKNEAWLVCLIFKQKSILLRFVVTSIWWISTIFVYFGLMITSVTISGNRSVNYSLISFVSMPGFWIPTLLLDRIGRKPLLMAAFWICGVCQLAHIFISKGNYWLSLSIFLVSELSIAAALSTIVVYSAELYPTRYRTSLFDLSSTCGTLSKVLIPLILSLSTGAALSAIVVYSAELYPTRYPTSLFDLCSTSGSLSKVLIPLILSLAAETWNSLPFAVFGGMAVLSGFLVLLVPETFGTTLPDTLEEAVNIGKKQDTLESACCVLQPLVQGRPGKSV